jgi:amino acid adenylation domain-containing protein
MRYLLHDVFTNTVELCPSKVAIVNENGLSINYRDLNSLSNKFANLLLEIKDNRVIDQPYIGIISPVHERSIACVIAALKIGCAYVPLDEYSPHDRLVHIVESTKLDVIVVDENWYVKHFDLFKNSNIKNVIILSNNIEQDLITDKAILFDEILKQSDTEPKKLDQVSDDLAYILHSSGSTGIPKGIMLTHRNARTFVDWMHKEFEVVETDIVMSRAPFKFDLSVFDIFNTFKAGATLICFDWNKKREEQDRHADYVRLMEKEKATILYTTPSTFISLMNRGGLSESILCLREVMYAGEPFPTPQLRKLQTAIPKTKIANIYGPTETNIITYYWVDNIPENNEPIPLGKVVDDTEIFVVSEDAKRICETGEMGELWCRGGTVTLGYLGMEEKTNEHLVQSPFHKYPVKFWRTGDFGYRDENGCLYYRGRKDHMIKVKGFRIEIGEVESAISALDGIDEFVVVAVPDDKYGNRLYCFYTIIKGGSISEVEIIDFLKKKLPDYMIPYKFFLQDVLPKTSSGKVDRVLLTSQVQNN